jgi:hypothetical protein
MTTSTATATAGGAEEDATIMSVVVQMNRCAIDAMEQSHMMDACMTYANTLCYWTQSVAHQLQVAAAAAAASVAAEQQQQQQHVPPVTQTSTISPTPSYAYVASSRTATDPTQTASSFTTSGGGGRRVSHTSSSDHYCYTHPTPSVHGTPYDATVSPPLDRVESNVSSSSTYDDDDDAMDHDLSLMDPRAPQPLLHAPHVVSMMTETTDRNHPQQQLQLLNPPLRPTTIPCYDDMLDHRQYNRRSFPASSSSSTTTSMRQLPPTLPPQLQSFVSSSIPPSTIQHSTFSSTIRASSTMRRPDLVSTGGGRMYSPQSSPSVRRSTVAVSSRAMSNMTATTTGSSSSHAHRASSAYDFHPPPQHPPPPPPPPPQVVPITHDLVQVAQRNKEIYEKLPIAIYNKAFLIPTDLPLMERSTNVITAILLYNHALCCQIHGITKGASSSSSSLLLGGPYAFAQALQYYNHAYEIVLNECTILAHQEQQQQLQQQQQYSCSTIDLVPSVFSTPSIAQLLASSPSALCRTVSPSSSMSQSSSSSASSVLYNNYLLHPTHASSLLLLQHEQQLQEEQEQVLLLRNYYCSLQQRIQEREHQQQLRFKKYVVLLASALCHNMAILYQNEYGNIILARSLRCQLIQMIHWENNTSTSTSTTFQSYPTTMTARVATQAASSTSLFSSTTVRPPSSSSYRNPTTTTTTSSSSPVLVMETTDFVFFHLGIFFAMIDDFRIAPAA